jgi:hypothetical protein
VCKGDEEMHVEFLREKKVCKNYEEKEEKMKTLTLSLKKQWFDMIKAGIKKEEYREIKAALHPSIYQV